MRLMAEYIMRGWIQAALLVAATGMVGASMPLFFPLMWLSSAGVALVTLSKGAYAGLRVAGVAAAVTGLIGQLLSGSPALIIALVVGAWIPALLVALVLRATVSLPVTLLTAGVLGMVPVISAYLMLGDPALWWRKALSGFALELTQSGGMDQASVDQLMDALVNGLTGGLGLMLTLWAVAGILIGRYWQALLFNPGGFRAEFLGLRLGRSAALGAGLLTAVGLFTGVAWIEDIARPLAVIFALQAAAVGHKAVDLKRLHKGLLTGMYVVVALLTTPLLHLMVIFGMADNWLDVRARLATDTSDI